MENIVTLPEIRTGLWEFLAHTDRPILIYGMGNGAEKLIAHLREIGRIEDGIFASDDFVRGQFFCNRRVERLADLIAMLPKGSKPIILLAFGTRLPSVIAQIERLAEEYTLLVPDMPIAGDNYFTATFYREHYSSFEAALALFQEPESRSLFCQMIEAKLTGELAPMFSVTHTEEQCYSVFRDRPISLAVDCGAYNGDTVHTLLSFRPEIERVIAVEADTRNYNKLARYAATDPLRITALYGALWNRTGMGIFAGSGNRNATLVGTASHQFRSTETPLLTVDTLPADRPIDYIKYDVEGAEYEALEGSKNTVLRDRPVLAVSLYHRPEDLFRIPLYIHSLNPAYRFYLRRTKCLPAWEIMLYAV